MRNARHPNYKGGAISDPRGYRLVYVGKAHHLADCRGYAYEHRLKAEKILGRKLRPQECVHHKKEGREFKGVNTPEMLQVFPNNAAHLNTHRKVGLNRKRWNEPNDTIQCACGCGTSLKRFDPSGRPRRFANGHSFRKGTGKIHSLETVNCACGCGEVIKRYDKYGRERRFISGHNSPTH